MEAHAKDVNFRPDRKICYFQDIFVIFTQITFYSPKQTNSFSLQQSLAITSTLCITHQLKQRGLMHGAPATLVLS